MKSKSIWLIYSIFKLGVPVRKTGQVFSDDFTKNDFVSQAAKQMNMTELELTNYLWQNYHPSNIWIVYSGIAISAVILLWLYDRFVIGRS